MDKKYIFMILLVLLLLVISLMFYKSQDIRRLYKAEVLKALEIPIPSENSILTEDDIKPLPEPVQKYLKYVGAIGKEKVNNSRMVLEGEMKMDPQKGWVNIRAEQYNFYDSATRLFFIKGNMSGLTAIGLDSYINGKGNMLIKLAGLLTVADGKGKEMDKGEAVTLFNDMCFFAPSTLIDKRIQWETLDSLTVKAVFDDKGCKVSALLYFNEKGEFINFVTDDRYMSLKDNTFKNIRWSTPVGNYKEINGFKLPSYGEAIWHMEEGEYCYARFTGIKNVEYNCKTFK